MMRWMTQNPVIKYSLHNACISHDRFQLTRILFRTLSTNNELTVHEISIKSCGSIYKKLGKEGKFSSVPKTDLTFLVKYFDLCKTCNGDVRVNKPVVVALHGAPGTCSDFAILTTYLHEKGVRIIAPTFPDFSSFRPGIFRHTDEEKAQYIKDFLSAISVNHVDLLICHSSSIYPGLILCLDQSPTIKSIAMLNAATFSFKMHGIKFYKTMATVVKASESIIFLKIMEAICPFLMKLAKIPVRFDTFMDPLLSATVMINGNIQQSKEKFLQLSNSGFPILYAFSEDDKLIGQESAYELAYFLGAEPSDIRFINREGNVVREGIETPNSKFMAFENGSHYVFWKYADVINEEIFKFLANQVNKNKK